LILHFYFLYITSLVVAEHNENKHWEEFKVQFSKYYKNHRHETERQKIFSYNLKHIEAHNDMFARGISTYKMGVNRFTDMTYEEFSNIMLRNMEKSGKTNRTQIHTNQSNIPNHKDWREDGIINPVKDQGHCGSCWAFATIASTEAYLARTGQGLFSLSEQMLIDCGTESSYGSCSGGWIDWGFDTIIDKGGDCREADYPYKAEDGESCNLKEDKIVGSISDYQEISLVTEESIYSNGPHAIKLYGNQNFQHYKSGIFDDESCPKDKHNHNVLNVGYDIDEGYWIIRNSWGDDWGEHGYIRIKSGTNICNCENYGAFPIGRLSN